MEFYTPQEPAAVAAFYSDDLMKQYGWSPQPYSEVNQFSVGHDQSRQIPSGETAGGCDSRYEFHGQPSIGCTFSKTDASGRHSELSIDIIPDSNTHQTLIDYMRFESKKHANRRVRYKNALS
jgi:hypothetical protein